MSYVEPSGAEDRESALRLFASRGIDIVIGVGFIFSSDIDTVAKRIRIEDGEMDYSALVLALGADPIPHGLSGDGTAAVLAVNDLDDYAAFRNAIEGKKHITVLGGGLIGCEFANDLVQAAWPFQQPLPGRDTGVRSGHWSPPVGC